MKAWLVTWQELGNSEIEEERLVAIFSARRGPERIKNFMEDYYQVAFFDANEMSECARYNRPTNPAYPAEYMKITSNNISFRGRITCGHNPFLYGRLVNSLVVSPSGEVTWKEIPLDVLRKATKSSEIRFLKSAPPLTP